MFLFVCENSLKKALKSIKCLKHYSHMKTVEKRGGGEGKTLVENIKLATHVPKVDFLLLETVMFMTEFFYSKVSGSKTVFALFFSYSEHTFLDKYFSKYFSIFSKYLT